VRPDARNLADEEVMQLVRGGDPRAFEVLYDRHAGVAFSLAYRIVGQSGRAEDVTQEAFISIWRSRQRYEPLRGSVRTWVLGIVHNRAVDVVRRNIGHDRRRAGIEAIEEHRGGPDRTDLMAAQREDALTVKDAMSHLPEDQRKTIELAYFGGFSHSEIAELLHMPVGTVKGRIRLGLDKLRLQLGGQEEALLI
jgi:RNA polymerase sigma-70 factor, ECF subfamily